jgi:hypothetical protein
MWSIGFGFFSVLVWVLVSFFEAKNLQTHLWYYRTLEPKSNAWCRMCFDYHNLNRCTLIKTIKGYLLKVLLKVLILKVKKKVYRNGGKFPL